MLGHRVEDEVSSPLFWYFPCVMHSIFPQCFLQIGDPLSDVLNFKYHTLDICYRLVIYIFLISGTKIYKGICTEIILPQRYEIKL